MKVSAYLGSGFIYSITMDVVKFDFRSQHFLLGYDHKKCVIRGFDPKQLVGEGVLLNIFPLDKKIDWKKIFVVSELITRRNYVGKFSDDSLNNNSYFEARIEVAPQEFQS